MDGRWRSWYESSIFQDEALPLSRQSALPTLPEPLRQARALAGELLGRGCSREEVFVRQGRLLADYEDETVMDRPVQHYYTTYQSLSDTELRGYFGWRTRWRRGEAAEGQLSYVFLHIYELLNQIGVRDPMDGWRQLLRFWDPEGEGRQLAPYLSRWLVDYVVFYGLSPELVSQWREVRRDRALLRWQSAKSDAQLLAAAAELSGIRLERSVLYRQYPAEYEAVAARVLRRMEEYFQKHRKQTMTDYFFGTRDVQVVTLFERAVFLDPDPGAKREYELTPLTRYRRHYGAWRVERRVPPRGKHRLAPVLREIDGRLRAALGVGRALKSAISTKWILILIDQEIDRLLEQRRQEEERRVHFDLSRLGAIRADADVTRERLIAGQEERLDGWEPPTAEPEPIPAEPQLSPETSAPGEDLPLEEGEVRLLRCLLYGGDTGWLAREGLLASVLTDSINEKLYDIFADTVLDESGAVIEDYIDELKEMVKP